MAEQKNRRFDDFPEVAQRREHLAELEKKKGDMARARQTGEAEWAAGFTTI